MKQANKRIKFVRCAHPTRNVEAPLLAAQPERWASPTSGARALSVKPVLLLKGKRYA